MSHEVEPSQWSEHIQPDRPIFSSQELSVSFEQNRALTENPDFLKSQRYWADQIAVIRSDERAGKISPSEADVLHTKLLARTEIEGEYDHVTGLYVRRAFIKRTEEVLAFARRTHQPVSLAIGDLDGFKKVNDDYGHPIGDAVLLQTAGVLTSSKRKSDIVGRWGGEEFAVLLPGITTDTALIPLMRIVHNMPAHTAEALEGMGLTLNREITMSIGVADTRESSDLEDLIKRADEAVYRAKDLGKNRVYIAENTNTRQPYWHHLH